MFRRCHKESEQRAAGGADRTDASLITLIALPADKLGIRRIPWCRLRNIQIRSVKATILHLSAYLPFDIGIYFDMILT
jgi:hypothetical protein